MLTANQPMYFFMKAVLLRFAISRMKEKTDGKKRSMFYKSSQLISQSFRKIVCNSYPIVFTGNTRNIGKDQQTVISNNGFNQPVPTAVLQSQPDYVEPNAAKTLVRLSTYWW